jgi:hypothetical protein
MKRKPTAQSIIPGFSNAPKVGDGNLPAGEPAPTRSSKPEVANSIKPGVRYQGDAASAAFPSGSNPRQQSKG